MKEALFERVSLHGENTVELTLLEQLLGIPTASLQQLIQSFRDEQTRRAKACQQAALGILNERGISGGAVVPSAALDPGWAQAMSGIEADFLQARRDLAASL
jgi:hypothetical protein